ncbi:MAG: GNAT family N-acetyltransferase, partial [Bacteroidales bacterium]|nr:GNAT family N-acetyltransferase [Bacteroidales bacterium]
EAVRQICGIAFQELALERIIGEVFPENLASARVLEKNGFQLEETKVGAVVKGGKTMDLRVFILTR